MLWGKGDSSKLDDKQRELMENLRRLVETGHIVALDPEDAKIALEAVEFFASWRSVFKVLSSVRNTLLLLGGILAIYWTMEGSVAEWVRSINQ